MRRFLARPSTVALLATGRTAQWEAHYLFSATGRSGPWPEVSTLSGAIPLLAR